MMGKQTETNHHPMRTGVQHLQLPGHFGRVLPISVLPAADPVQQLGPNKWPPLELGETLQVGGKGYTLGQDTQVHGFLENDLDMVVNFYSFDGF